MKERERERYQQLLKLKNLTGQIVVTVVLKVIFKRLLSHPPQHDVLETEDKGEIQQVYLLDFILPFTEHLRSTLFMLTNGCQVLG